MADRPRRVHGSGVLVVLAALLACGTSPERGPLVETSCSNDNCQTTGSARRTTGLTADSVGFTIGPGLGTLTLSNVEVRERGEYDVFALIRGSGFVRVSVDAQSCAPLPVLPGWPEPPAPSCSTVDVGVSEKYRWVPVAARLRGPESIDVSIQTVDETSEVQVLNVGFQPSPVDDSGAGCSSDSSGPSD